jgi:hypothetical protein
MKSQIKMMTPLVDDFSGPELLCADCVNTHATKSASCRQIERRVAIRAWRSLPQIGIGFLRFRRDPRSSPKHHCVIHRFCTRALPGSQCFAFISTSSLLLAMLRTLKNGEGG